MKSKRLLSAFLVAVLLLLSLAACGSDSKTPAGNNSNISSEEEPEIVYYNPYTGLPGYSEEDLFKRPLAVMINNIQQALPQRGISKADIIFELPVEGPITRMMAVFADPAKIPEVGSIRSARHDFVELVKPLNAIYLHFGGSTFAKEAISKYGIDDIEGLYMSGTAFYWDSERGKTKSREHCWFSTAELLAKGIEKQNFNTKTDSEVQPIFNFIKEDETKNEQPSSEENSSSGALAANQALNISAPMSSTCTATFTYDEQSKTYKKGEYGADHIDETTGKAIEVKNVFLMYTDVSLMADGYHKEIDMSKGSGYYISNGILKKVTFKKPSVDDMIKVYDEDGAVSLK